MAAQSEPTTATSTTSDGPVLAVISKRLRALRKKHNRIIQMEESLAQGKTLNKEQQDVLRSKPAVLTLIEELEKLRHPLSAALDEELSLALEKSQQQPPQQPPEQNQQEHEHHRRQQEGDEDAVPGNGNGEPNDGDNVNGGDNGSGDGVVAVVKDLLNLMYFGSLFDLKSPSEFASITFSRTHERDCCLSYDYVPDDATDMLSEMDLDLISALQGLMVSRPANSTLTHQNALDECVQHARRWIQNSDQPIHPSSQVTYAALREKLNKIMASGFFTATPHMKGPGEVAAAVAVANFGSFNVPVHGAEVNAEVPVQVEGSQEQYQETEGNAANYEEYESVEQQPGNAEEFPKDELEPENPPEVVSSQTEQEQFHNAEGEYRNADFKDQQYGQRRGQRGGRGGGRRGYSNGRGGRGSSWGGGSYQNGRNQHYDNGYPSRNYYNRRGGRGGSGGGGGYYNSSLGAPGNNQANAGVAS